MSKFHIDWLSLTTKVPSAHSYDCAADVVHVLGGEWRWGRGRNGYRQAFRHESGGVILFDGEEGMGVHLVLPSQALAYFSDSLQELFESWEWKASRMDVCVDAEAVSVDFFIENQDVIVCRAQERAVYHDMSTGGKTLYVGSRHGSRKLVRIYDKGVEQKTHGPGQLTRIEVQLREEYADAAFRYVRNGGSLADVAVRCIDFRSPGRGPKCTWERLDWWAEMLTSCSFGFRFPLRLRAEQTLEAAVSWIEKQVAKSLAKCHAALGETWLRSLLFRGAAQLDVAFYNSLSPPAAAPA